LRLVVVEIDAIRVFPVDVPQVLDEGRKICSNRSRRCIPRPPDRARLAMKRDDLAHDGRRRRRDMGRAFQGAGARFPEYSSSFQTFPLKRPNRGASFNVYIYPYCRFLRPALEE
jgi:hypothetical protein